MAVVSSASCEFPSMEGAGDSMSPGGKGGDSSGDQDSGISLQIPSWKGPPLVRLQYVAVSKLPQPIIPTHPPPPPPPPPHKNTMYNCYSIKFIMDAAFFVDGS